MTAYGTRAAAGSVVFLTLAAGFLLGLVWSRISAEQVEPTMPTSTAVAAEEADEDRGRENRRRGLIVERVGLSAEQRAQVDSVMGHARGMMRQLRAEYRTGYGELIESTRTSIKELLTPDQAAEYDELLSDFDRRRAEEAERERERERGASDARDRGRDGGRDDGGDPRRDGRDGEEREWDRGEWTYTV